MLTAGRRDPDPELVAAARTGDARALDELVAESLPLVYNIVGRALRAHADVDDVVQETMLRVVRSLRHLNDPEAYRSWLVAITIRQVREYEQNRKVSTVRNAALDVALDTADPASDFAGVTILRLGLTDQRKDVAQATRWLDPDDREVLSLWWLEETGELDRATLAAALDLSPQHAAVRVQRVKERLDTAREVVRALQADPHCQDLNDACRGWDGHPTPLWRKRLARHVRNCADCGLRTTRLHPIQVLLNSMPPVPLPASLNVIRIPYDPSYPFAPHTPTNHPVANTAHTPRPATTNTTATHTTTTLRKTSHLRRLLHTGTSGAPLTPTTAIASAAVLVAAVVVGVRLSSSPTPTTPAAAVGPTATITPSAAAPSATASSPHAQPSSSSSASPSAKRTTAAALAPETTKATGPKKGVGVWNFTGVDQALAQSGASWYYTWSTQHSGIGGASGVGFVPMIRAAANVTASTLTQAKAEGPYLLGFNEPDMSSQASMTVVQALNLWPQLMSTGLTLGSPSVAYGADTPGGWLDQFMAGAKTRGYRVDFITLHWYGSDFVTAEAVSQLKSYIQAVYNRYHLPIWLTEYALIDFSHGETFPTDPQQAAFVTASTHMLTALPYLQRYAWFGLPASDTGPSSGLFRSGPTVTPAGRAFEAAPGN